MPLDRVVRSCRAAVYIAAPVVLLSVSFQHDLPQQPTFTGGVELVTLDVTVLDKSGKPVADLRAKDFSVSVSGKQREVVGAEFVRSGTWSSVPQTDLAASSATDASPPQRRSIVVAVDTENTRFGEGHNVFEDLANRLANLPATDEIGLVTFPENRPNVELTLDREAIRHVLRTVIGTGPTLQGCEPTFGEAASGGAAFDARTGGRCGGSAQLLGARTRHHAYTSRLLQSLTKLARSMSELPGRHVIVLLSQGLYLDDDLRRDLSDFGAALEASRVVLYALHIDFPREDASSRVGIGMTNAVDDRKGFDAMAEVSVAGGGEAVRIIAGTAGPLKRIDAALSGYYVLAFKRQPQDQDGKHLGVRVKVSRGGMDVRAPTQVTITGKRRTF